MLGCGEVEGRIQIQKVQGTEQEAILSWAMALECADQQLTCKNGMLRSTKTLGKSRDSEGTREVNAEQEQDGSARALGTGYNFRRRLLVEPLWASVTVAVV